MRSFTRQSRCAISAAAILICIGCGAPTSPDVEDLSGRESLSFFKLGSLRGTRDGDRLTAKAIFTDSSSILTIDLKFAIGSPTRLESGAWRWTRNNTETSGTVAERSVNFLGGQDGPPSIGGKFDLLGPDGIAHYRVNIPTTQLKTRL